MQVELFWECPLNILIAQTADNTNTLHDLFQ
jgi:hypothetical protein